MGFEDILDRRLGPMKDWVRFDRAASPRSLDPAKLYYRRAAGLEIRVLPEDSWSRASITAPTGSKAGRAVDLDAPAVRAIAGLTRWTSAEALTGRPGVSAKKLWSWAEQGFLYFSEEDPERPLTGAVVETLDDQVARRGSVWLTTAVETAVEIAPMPFMPRGRDLLGARLVGFRLASLERSKEVLGVTIVGTEKTGRLLREIWPRLDGRRSIEEIVRDVPSALANDARRALEWLDALTLLERPNERVESERSALADVSEPYVTWLGHAGVLFQDLGTRILVDPAFFSMSDPPEPFRSHRGFDPRTLPDLDAVLITHGDNDHLNPSSLAVIPKKVPIYIPRVPDPAPPHQVDMLGILHVLGFEKIIEVDDWQELEIGLVRVTVCPFVGEDWGLELGQQTYLLEGPELSVYLSADSHRMDETYAWLAKRPKIDLAFLGISGSAENYAAPAEYGYGNFYEQWVPPSQHAQWVQHCAGPKESAEHAKVFEPRFAFGYAAGGASFIQTSHGDVGTHEELAELLRDSKVKAVELPLGKRVTLSQLVRDRVPSTPP